MGFHYADDVPIQVGDRYMGHALVAPDNNDFSPRVGLAYSPTGRWTFRSGFGVFYARDIGNTVFDMARNLGGRGQFAANTEIPNSPIEDPWGSLRGVASCSGWSGLCSVQPQIFTQPYNTRTPYVLEWLFNIQRQLSQNILLEVSYQGSESHKLQGQRYYNQAVPRAGLADATNPWRRAPFAILLACLIVFGFFPRLLTDKIKLDVQEVLMLANSPSSRMGGAAEKQKEMGMVSAVYKQATPLVF